MGIYPENGDYALIPLNAGTWMMLADEVRVRRYERE